MNLPSSLKEALENQLGAKLKTVQPVSGGDINEAARVETASESYFLKWNAHSPVGMFTAEARGLGLLASANALRLPQVIAYREATPEAPAFLLLEWLPPVYAKNSDQLAERLGTGLAALHQHTAALHGLDHDNFIGSLPQPNTQQPSWIAFYRDQRIGSQARIAQQQGYLPAHRARLLEALYKKLPDLLPDAPPSLLHGDLWGGNYMAISGDIPVIYDPAVYYGHREVELAFTELFGGFSPRFYAAYNATFPLDSGYRERKELYQLYPIMVHMNLFGGGYALRVDDILRHYVG